MNEIWECVHQRFELRGTTPRVLSKQPLHEAACSMAKPNGSMNWREYFIIVVSSLLLSCVLDPLVLGHLLPITLTKMKNQLGNYFVVLQYLFCNRILRNKHLSKIDGLQLSLYGHGIRPVRFAKYLGCTSFTIIELLEYLMDVCKVFPKSIVVDCVLCADSTLLLEVKANGSRILPTFFSQVGEVYFVGHSLPPHFVVEDCKVASFILETVLSNEKSCLYSVIIDVDEVSHNSHETVGINRRVEEMLKCLLAAISPFFVNSYRPYLGLKRLHVYAKYKGQHMCAGVTNIAMDHLFSIVQGQRHLESLSISGWWTRSRAQKVDSLCSLFFGSSLTSVHLKLLDLPVVLVQELIQVFLYSPCSRSRELVLQSVWMYEDSTNITPNCVDHPDSDGGTEHKSLHLIAMYIPNHFIAWLSNLVAVRLHMLVLSDIQYDPDMMPGGILGALGQHPNSQIQIVHLNSHTVDCPKEGLELLLQNPSVKHLHLTGPRKDLLDNLVLGLLNQAEVGALETLSVKEASFTEVDLSDFKRLLTALFHLPQLQQLTVDFSKTIFSTEQIATWRECSKGKKLKQLLLPRYCL